jgi:hypothetical protein
MNNSKKQTQTVTENLIRHHALMLHDTGRHLKDISEKKLPGDRILELQAFVDNPCPLKEVLELWKMFTNLIFSYYS